MPRPPGRLLTFPTFRDPRGNLTFLETPAHVPFAIQRVYYLHGVPSGQDRGAHAHKDLRQVLIAVAGAFTVVLDDGTAKASHRLADPTQGLLVESMQWRELTDFAPGSVCLVLASRPYDESDYIRDHAEFLRAVRSARPAAGQGGSP